jgi:hypothetical protein
MEPRKPRRYLVVVRLSDKDEPLAVRIGDHVPLIMDVLSRFNVGQDRPVRAFSSATGEFFGCLIASELDAHGLRSQIDSPGTNDPRNPAFHDKRGALPSPLRRFDQVLVLECGTDFATSSGLDALNGWFSKPLTSLADLFGEKPRPDADALQAKVDLVKFMIDQQEVSDRDLILQISTMLA